MEIIATYRKRERERERKGIKRGREEDGKTVESSGRAVGFRVFALPTQLYPGPSANPSVYVWRCRGRGRGRRCAKAGVKLALGVGGGGSGSFRRLQISKMHTDLVHPLPSRRG